MSEITELKGLVTKLLPVKLLVNNEGQIEGVPKNPRFIKDWRYKLLLQSLTESPEMLSLKELWVYKVGDLYVVIAGNMRLRGSKEKGYKSLPCKILPPETSVEKLKEYAIKDNAGYGDWEMDSLANEWESPKIVEWGVELNGWENGDEPFGSETAEAKEDNFDTTPPAVAKTVLGDLYEIGSHRLLCADCTDVAAVAKLMQGELADMVMTDPPYNVNYVGKQKSAMTIDNDNMSDEGFYAFLLLFYTAFADVTKAGGAWYVWHADSEGVNFRKAFQESGLLMKQCLIWVKNALVMGRQDYHWKHEPCIYGWKEGAAHYFTDDRTKTTVLHHDKPTRNDLHPTMKPILLLAPLIENSSKQGWLVADPFLGSGSTMVAAHQLKRKCFGCEISPQYCDVIVKRMLNLDSTLRVKRNGVDVTEEWRA